MYAIADISYSFAYAIGPVVAGQIVEHMSFTALNIIVAVLSIAYAPILYFLKDMYDYKNFDENLGDGGGVKIGDPPQKQYQTVALQVILTYFFCLLYAWTFYTGTTSSLSGEAERIQLPGGPAGDELRRGAAAAGAAGGGRAAVEPVQSAAEQQSLQKMSAIELKLSKAILYIQGARR